MIYLIFIVFTCILYGNTLSNKYALDDLYAITGNTYTQQGFSGIHKLLTTDFFSGYYGDQRILLTGGRYRPLSLITFAVEHQFFGENPGISHFINLLLYALTACLLFYWLKKLFTADQSGKWYLSLPFIAVMIFIAHPVHTEVVANIKGRDEILALLGSVLAAVYYVKYLEHRKYTLLAGAFISFFLACMSKESALLFVVIIPLSVYFFKNSALKDNVLPFVSLASAALLFFIIRWSVTGNPATSPSVELLDNPFIHADVPVKYATIFYTLGLYIKLLFFPHPLTWDYYPYHIPLMNWNSALVLGSVVLYLAMMVWAVYGTRKKSFLSFSLWVFLVSIFLYSNILFAVGVFMAERFLYVPSLAFCLIIGWLMAKVVSKGSSKVHAGQFWVTALLGVILILFSWKTISRNTVWQDDFTLITTDAETSANSAKSCNLAGQWYAWAANQPANAAEKQSLMQKAYMLEKRAVDIHPDYQDAWFRLGNVVFDYRHNADSTLLCYLKILKKNPNEENVFKNLTMVINSIDDNKRKISLWEKVLAVSPDRFEPNFYLANFYFDLNPDKSIAFARKAREIRPGDAPNLKVLASGLLNQRQFREAIPIYNEYLKINLTDTMMIKTRNNLEKFLKHPF